MVTLFILVCHIFLISPDQRLAVRQLERLLVTTIPNLPNKAATIRPSTCLNLLAQSVSVESFSMWWQCYILGGYFFSSVRD